MREQGQGYADEGWKLFRDALLMPNKEYGLRCVGECRRKRCERQTDVKMPVAQRSPFENWLPWGGFLLKSIESSGKR